VIPAVGLSLQHTTGTACSICQLITRRTILVCFLQAFQTGQNKHLRAWIHMHGTKHVHTATAHLLAASEALHNPSQTPSQHEFLHLTAQHNILLQTQLSPVGTE
jgi:hypothetical protein